MQGRALGTAHFYIGGFNDTFLPFAGEIPSQDIEVQRAQKTDVGQITKANTAQSCTIYREQCAVLHFLTRATQGF